MCRYLTKHVMSLFLLLVGGGGFVCVYAFSHPVWGWVGAGYLLLAYISWRVEEEC